MEENLVTIYTAANSAQAQLLRDRLLQVGIHAWTINEPLAGGAGELPVGWSTSPRVVVANTDAVAAREIAEHFNALAAQHSLVAGDRAGLEQAERTIDDAHYIWPRCSQCQERRLAVCPFCKTAGNDFALAYTGPDADTTAQRVMVECPTCDEAFYPQFYKRCEHCGHAFDDGVPLREPRGLAPMAAPTIETRTWILLGATIAVCAALTIYFWALVRE